MAIFKEENVIDRWSEVVPHAEQHAATWLRSVIKRMDEMQLPVTSKEEKVATGFIKSVTGGGRNVVSISPSSKALNRVTILLFAFPIGTTVTIGWFAVGEGNFGQNAGIRIPIVHDLDVFDQVDLRALLASIHEFAVLPAAEGLFKQAEVDLTQLNRQTKGYFQL
jgi:hypothetical protein